MKRPVRVIYVEGGGYRDYFSALYGLINGLHGLGLVREAAPPAAPDSSDSLALWRWLSRSQGKGGELEFPEDGFYSADWSESAMQAAGRAVAERVSAGKGADLVLALGTRAGLELAVAGLPVPVMSLSTVDPEGAGIAPRQGAEGPANLHVFVRRDRIPAQLRFFSSVFGFRRLGVPLEASELGRLSMGWPTVERTAAELGFEAVPCLARMERPDREAALRALVGCLERLSLETDAVYLTVNNGMLKSRMGEILAPVIRKGLPSFSQEGSEDVRAGVLLSAGQDDFADIGLFEAKALSGIIGGARPSAVPGLYRAHASVALNLTTALRIGWNPPFAILVDADRVYRGMGGPENGRIPGPAPLAALR
ncbi:MAG: ABC transporter substrate-binding protein [Deltaproteobacteria bacterium]|jgi:hypothetical protein|nr:ABC transporter substrate-binding protein [Deltaproteobacteria bacterium]